nr:retrovirus-related Pol polyprotein from transposon TNT 1-94 [Tanacetum cinerariifolium]
MAIEEDEPSVGKADARLGQWVDITMKKVHRLLSMTDGDERKHVLDYTHVDLHYMEDQRKNLVVFTKADESLSVLAPKITPDSESECNSLEPLPPLPKLIGAAPSGTLERVISLSDLTLNMADLTLDTPDSKKTRPSVKVLTAYVIKKKTEKSPANPNPCSDKKADSSTKQLLLMLTEEAKGLKEKIEIPTGTPSSSSYSSSSKASMQKTWFGPCKHYGFRNHLSDDCYSKPKCSTYRSTNHLTKEHLEHATVKKTLRDQGLPAGNQNPLKSGFTKGTNLCENVYAGLPQEESGPKVVFGDYSSGDTEGYCSVNYNGITFIMVAYVNGLKHNLISISQLCDANYKVLFTKTQGTIYNQNNEVVLIAPRRRDFYVIDMSSFNKESNVSFFAKASPSVNWLWHKRMSHLNFKNINNLEKHNLVSGLPSLTFSKDKNCSAYEKVKHHRASFKTKRSFSINKSQHLLRMDLFGPVKPQTISHNKYTFIIVDEYLRYTWVFFLKKKNDTVECIMSFIKKIENLDEVRVKELRSENRTEFRNHKLEEFYDEKGISQNFSSPCTPEQNVVAERSEAARTMLNSAKLLKQFGERLSTLPATHKTDLLLWSREKHIEHVNIIGEPLAGITTRSRIRDSDVASATECLYGNFLFEMEPKKLVKALEEEGWIIAMQKELNQFERNKEGIDYEETFAHVARLKAIMIFFAYEAYMGFMVYQMDVNSAFLNGKILKEYDLADCALVKYPMLPPNNLGPDESGVSVSETLFRGMIGSLMYLTASRPGIEFSTCLCARYQANPKESRLVVVKKIRYLKGTLNLGLWYLKGSYFDLKAYSDSDYAGCNLDRKSTSGAEAEYVAAVGCCAQVLWIKSQLADYDVLYDKVPIFCNNTSAIAISNNPVLHSMTKHIDIRYHFIRDHILKGDIELHFLPTDLQLADIFTKPLAEPRFTRLVAELGMLNIEKERLKMIPRPSPSYFHGGINPCSLLKMSSYLPLAYLCPLPPKETVRAGLATLAKLSEEPEVNADDTTDKSLSKASVQPVIQSKATTDLKTKKKKISPSSKPKSPYKVRVILPKKQVAETQHTEVTVATADATRVLDQHFEGEKDVEFVTMEEVDEEQSLEIPTVEKLLDEADKLNKAVQEPSESPYDTKSEIKVVKSFFTCHISELKDQTMNDSEETVDINEGSNSDLQSMPDDNLRSVLGFHTADSDDTHENKVSKSDHIFQDDNAFVERLSLPDHMDHICEEVSSLYSRLREMESSIVQQVSANFKSSLPAHVSNSLKEQLSSLFLDALKDTLPQLLKDFIKSSVSKSISEELPHVEAQKELSKSLYKNMKKSIRLKVKKGMKEVRDKLSSCTSTVAANSQYVYNLKEKKEVNVSMEDDSDDDDLDKQPLSKRFKIMTLIPNPIPMNTFVPKRLLKPEEQKKSLHDFTNQMFGTTSSKFSPNPPREPIPPRDPAKGKEISVVKEQKDKSEQELRKMFNQITLKAQAKKWTEHEAKKAKILEEYNHQISFRANPLPITKISSTAMDQDKKLGLPTPLALATFRMTPEEKKKKRTQFLKEAFVTEDIRVNGMNRILIPTPGVMPIEGLFIKEHESGIFYINRNTDIVVQRESEF